MKHLIVLLMMIMCAADMTAQESFTDKLGTGKGVTSVFISKTMLSMMPDMKSNGKDFGAVASKLDNIQILNSENAAAAAKLKKGCLQIISKNNYNYLMNVSEGSEKSGIYMKEFGRGTNQFVLLTTDKSEVSIIVLTGKLTLKDIRKVMGQ